MNWTTDEHTSYPEDGRAWLERSGDLWWIYETEGGYVVIPDLPKLTDHGFQTVRAAQAWVECYVSAPSGVPDDWLDAPLTSKEAGIVAQRIDGTFLPLSPERPPL